MSIFPALTGFEPTRKTLHSYSNVLAVIPRAHLPAHPLWWHISLSIQADGLCTQPIPLPAGGQLTLRLDLQQHLIIIADDQGTARTLPLTAGLSSAEMGDQVITAVSAFGLSGDYLREKYADMTTDAYDETMAGRFFEVISEVDRIFKAHMATLAGKKGEVHLWPHGFDVSVEWFGTRTVTAEEHGQVQEFPSQINLGFYPGNETTEPYFYSNPWPFEKETYLSQPLPAGARWFTDGWEGSILPYAALVNDDTAEQRLRNYAQAVFDLASPTLV